MPFSSVGVATTELAGGSRSPAIWPATLCKRRAGTDDIGALRANSTWAAGRNKAHANVFGSPGSALYAERIPSVYASGYEMKPDKPRPRYTYGHTSRLN